MLSEKTRRKLKGLETCSHNGKHKCRNLFKIAMESRDLWLQAYANIYANSGATTVGSDGASLDGQSLERIERLIGLLKSNKYFPVPSRRVYIPKPNGKKRPLGVPSGHDKLVQEVWRILLEAVYEPTFHENSHGFRPKRSCHTALKQIQASWTGTKWFIEFDIKGYFDNIDHNRLVEIIEKRIDDRRFIAVIKRMMKAGYMEDWSFHKTYSGTPQGGVISPVLANIYLDELDQFVSTLQTSINCGKGRKRNIAYGRICRQRAKVKRRIDLAKKEGDSEAAKREVLEFKRLGDKLLETSSMDQYDPSYRRLRYSRYADDFLLGFIGPKKEANAIHNAIKQFVEADLNLEIAEEKSGVKHAPTEGCVFLGHAIDLKPTPKTKWVEVNGIRCKRRTMQQHVSLRIPTEKLRAFAGKNGYGNYATKSAKHRSWMINMSDAEIVLQVNAELRGFSQFYALTNNPKSGLSAIVDLGRQSMLRTMAAKHKCSVRTVSRRIKHGKRRGVKTANKFYQVWTLSQLAKPISVLADSIPITAKYSGRTELVDRLLANRCEYCGDTKGKFEVHHVRKLKDVKDGTEKWKRLMIARNRKTLVLCVKCHDLLHAGKLPDNRYSPRSNMESRVQ